jgi:CRP/FNR family transcriptional regulator
MKLDRLIKDFQVSCNNCYLDTICLPRGLSQKEVEDLSIVVKSNAVIQKGEYIYRQGDEFKSIVAIKSGTAKLVANDEQGNVHILNVLLPGELSGFDGLYQNNYNSSAIALERMSYCELPVDQFETLCLKIPAIARELFKHSSELLNESQSQLVMSKRSAEDKLAMFLMSLSDRLKKRGFSSLEFNIPLTRQEMGEHLGLSLETVSRMLHQFQVNGLIKVQRKHIEINDLQGLRDIYSR